MMRQLLFYGDRLVETRSYVKYFNPDDLTLFAGGFLHVLWSSDTEAWYLILEGGFTERIKNEELVPPEFRMQLLLLG